MTLDSTFLNKTASSDEEERRELTSEELVKTKPNQRVTTLEVSHPRNKTGIRFQVFCNNNKLNLDNAKGVTLYNGVWHAVVRTNRGFAVKEPIPSIHNYDIVPAQQALDEGLEESRKPRQAFGKTKQTDSRDESIASQRTLDEQIRNSPVNIVTPLPTASVTTNTPIQTAVPGLTQTTLQPIMATQTTTLPTSTATTIQKKASIKATTSPAALKGHFDKALRRDGGGGGRGGGSGGGGGGTGGGGHPAPQPQQPIPAAADIKAMGKLPEIFGGNREQADDFIEAIKGYLRLNQDIAGFDSPIKKVAFTLTHMQGPEVAGWVKDMGTMLDGLNPATDNIPDLWNQFLEEFEAQYQDSQRVEKAKDRIEKLKMRWPNIDQYISEFEELC